MFQLLFCFLLREQKFTPLLIHPFCNKKKQKDRKTERTKDRKNKRQKTKRHKDRKKERQKGKNLRRF
jgi:hypothetical protein